MVSGFLSKKALLGYHYNTEVNRYKDMDQGCSCDKGVMSSQSDKEADKTPKSFTLGNKVEDQDCCQCLTGVRCDCCWILSGNIKLLLQVAIRFICVVCSKI